MKAHPPVTCCTLITPEQLARLLTQPAIPRVIRMHESQGIALVLPQTVLREAARGASSAIGIRELSQQEARDAIEVQYATESIPAMPNPYAITGPTIEVQYCTSLGEQVFVYFPKPAIG